MIARYRSVLGVPGSPRLYATSILARLPQGMAGLAILLLVRESARSYAVAGLADGVNALASAVVGPTQGRLVDRVGRAPILVPCAILQAALFVGLDLAARGRVGAAVLVVLAAAAGAAQPAVAPATRALLQRVFGDPGVRELAYGVEAVFQEFVWTFGPLLVAVCVAVASASGAVLLAAALVLVGTMLFVASPASRRHAPTSGRREAGVLRDSPQLLRLLVPIGLIGLSIGTTEVGLPSLALHAGSPASTGLLLAVWSVGSMVGGVVYGGRSWGGSLDRRYRALLSLAVLCALPLVFARSIAFGFVGAFATGLAIAPTFSCQNALIGRIVAPEAQTEAFTWVSSSIILGIAAGSAIGGAIIGPLGVGAPFVLACAAFALAAVSSSLLPARAVVAG